MDEMHFLQATLPLMQEEFKRACRKHGWTAAAALRDHQKMLVLQADSDLQRAYAAAQRRVAAQLVNETADEMGLPRFATPAEHAQMEIDRRAQQARMQRRFRKIRIAAAVDIHHG